MLCNNFTHCANSTNLHPSFPALLQDACNIHLQIRDYGKVNLGLFVSGVIGLQHWGYVAWGAMLGAHRQLGPQYSECSATSEYDTLQRLPQAPTPGTIRLTGVSFGRPARCSIHKITNGSTRDPLVQHSQVLAPHSPSHC